MKGLHGSIRLPISKILKWAVIVMLIVCVYTICRRVYRDSMHGTIPIDEMLISEENLEMLAEGKEALSESELFDKKDIDSNLGRCSKLIGLFEDGVEFSVFIFDEPINRQEGVVNFAVYLRAGLGDVIELYPLYQFGEYRYTCFQAVSDHCIVYCEISKSKADGTAELFESIFRRTLDIAIAGNANASDG